MISQFIPAIPSVEIDGIYGTATREAVLAFQRRFGLDPTGEVDPDKIKELTRAAMTPACITPSVLWAASEAL